MPPDNPIRVAIVDDHPIFRLGVCALLGSEPDVRLVAEARDGDEALRVTEEYRPDVVLLDLLMPGTDGLDILPRLLELDPDLRVVIVTASIDPAATRQAFERGARGVLQKHMASELLVRCIRQVMSGERWVHAEVAAQAVQALRMREEGARPAPPLTAREVDIIRRVVRAETNKQIAAHLEIGEQTVKNHLRNIFEKLGVANRVELALRALDQQLTN
jgi:DNA-binding NarL/FixJ family response regulator